MDEHLSIRPEEWSPEPIAHRAVRSKGPRLDATITLGNVLTIIIMLAGMWAATVRLEVRLTAIETKMDPMWQRFIQESPSR